MKLFRFALILFFITVAGPGCTDDSPRTTRLGTVSHAEQDDLYKSWTHSREEDPEGSTVQVYRPTSGEFPPSRFRQVYEFSRDGAGSRLVLDPADAHHMESMSWSRDDKSPSFIYIKDESGTVLVSFEILELTSEMLRIRP